MTPVARPPVYTVGHSTRSIAEFVELLKIGRVDLVVDIRSTPRSRTNPQFNLDALPDEVRVGLSRLTELSRELRCAIMCSEAVWWRCHRRFVADYLLGNGRNVFHLMGVGRVEAAKMTPAARPDGASLVYPALEERTANDP
jgi:uncharacterized protein (DUF488 family)